jgi:hypothetical protein
LSAGDESSVDSRSLVVQSSASDPLGFRGDTDSVRLSDSGSEGVGSVALDVSWPGGVVVGISPRSSKVVGKSFVGDVDSGVDDSDDGSGSSVKRLYTNIL